jgi:hypothetical protein
MAGFYKLRDEPYGSIKGGDFLDHLSDNSLLN